MALVERVSVIVFFSSGMKIFFFCRLTYFLTFPVGLNLVARMRLEYPPATLEPLFVTGQIFAIAKSLKV